MGRPRQAPDREWLQKAYEKGWTYPQMVRMWKRESGHVVTVGAMRSAASRAKVAGVRTPRYRDYLPWTMRVEHQNNREPRCLRLAKRRASDQPLTDTDLGVLNLFLSELEARHAVIAYVRDTEQGWWWVDRDDLPPVDYRDPDTLRLQAVPG